MMKRCELKLTYQVLSPLHVGSGQSTPVLNDKGEKQGETALMVRNADRGVHIPGSTLKGAFRDLAGGGKGNPLFGQEHAKGIAFLMGELTFFGADQVLATPAVDNQGQRIKTRTRVHEGTGVSRAGLLFSEEYLDIGETLTGRIVLTAKIARFRVALRELLVLLDRFHHADGIPVAAGKADGLGRLQLTGATATTQELQERKGWSSAEPMPFTLAAKPDPKPWTHIPLSCPGP